MKISSIKKALKISILMTVILALPIMYTMATENAISYTLSEDKKSAVIHIDVNKVIGSNALVEVKDQDNNLLTEYDITVTENGTYSYTVIYKETVIKESEIIKEDVPVDEPKLEENNSDTFVVIDETPVDIKNQETQQTENDQEIQEVSAPNDSQMSTGETATPQEPALEQPSTDTNVPETPETQEEQVPAENLNANEQNQTKELSHTNNVVYETRSEKLEITVKGIIKDEKTTFNLRAMPDDFLFNEETGTITGYNASVVGEKEIVIPDQIGGKDVLYIGENALSGQQIKKITFETTKLKAIGNYALSNNYIEEITIPSSVETIGEYAFGTCENLVAIYFENEENIKSINKRAFSNCISLITIKIPKNITSIEDYLFMNCNKLETIEIPNGVTKIGEKAFSSCTNLIEINIPKGVTEVGQFAFNECNSLMTINFPDTVTQIGDSVCYGCVNLTSVNLSNSLVYLGDDTFYKCNKLNSINIPDNLVELGNDVFFECRSLKEIILPVGLTEIGIQTFAGTGISSIVLPNGLETIGAGAFSGTYLNSLIIPNTVTYIGSGIVARCHFLDTIMLETDISKNIYIRYDAFENNDIKDIYINNLDSGSIEDAPWKALYATVHWKNGIDNPVAITIGDYEFDTQSKTIKEYLGNETEVNIPESLTYNDVLYNVERVGENAFSNNSKLTQVIIPDSVIRIEYRAFKNCTKLNNIKLSNSLKYIDDEAFYSTKITTIVIPPSVTDIRPDSFRYSSLKDIYILEKKSNSINDSYGDNWGALYARVHWENEIEIPCLLKLGYYEYDTRIEGISKYIGMDKEINIPRFFNYNLDENNANDIRILEVTRIGENTFNNKSVESVNIPNSVKMIMSNAFSNCNQLKNITIPNSVTSIGQKAFNNCTNLNKIVLPSNLNRLSNEAFIGCKSLKSITIPKNLDFISEYLFNDTQLERIYVDQPRGSLGSHKYQPWGAPTTVQVFYQGESVEFQHSVEKNPTSGYDIQIKANILKNGVFINGIELPDGKIVRVGAQYWPSKNTYTYHVDNAGVYTFKGYDNRNLEYTYDVRVDTASINYHSNISSSNDDVVTKETLVGKNYIVETHDDLNMSRDDAVFMGWNTSADGTGSLYQPGDEIDINGDVTLYAQWKHYAEGTVLFKIRNGDETLGTLDKNEYAGNKGERLGNNAAKASTTNVDGASFIGWYKNNQKIDNISDEIIGDNTVYEARFMLDRDNDGNDDRLNKYKVNFIIRESDKQKAIITSDSVEVRYNQKLGNQTPGYIIDTEVAPNVTFDGWYKNGVKVSQLSDEVITDNVTYEARFNGEISKYRMNFIIDIEDGILNNTETYISQIIEMDGTVSIPTVTVNEGKKFMGWYKQNDENQVIVNEADIIPEMTTYVAKIENIYQVNFKIRDGDSQKGKLDKTDATVLSGTQLETVIPAITTQKWSKFIGWYIEDKKIEDLSKYTISENTIVEARFETLDGVIIIPGTDGKEDTTDDVIVQPGKIDDKGNVIIPDGGTIIYPNGSEEDFPDGGIILPGEDGELGTKDDIIVKPATIDDQGNIIIPDGGTIIYPDGSHEDFLDGGIILPGEDDELGTKDDIIVKPGTIDDKGNIIVPDGGTIIYPDGSHEDFPNGGIILPGEDGELGTKDDIIVKPAKIDDKGNIIIPDGGTIIYPDESHEDFPDGGIILPGEDGELGTKDDIIVKPGTIDDKGNIIIPDGGTIIYPDGSHEDFPDGGIILPGEDGELGTKDDIIVKPAKIDDNENIIIPDGGTIIYPDGSHEDFPHGGIILPGEDRELGTKDDIIVKPGTIDDKGNIIIPNGGVIIYPDGRREEFPNGGTLYAGMDGVFGTQDDLLIRNIKEDSSNTINISTDNQNNNNNKQTITDNALTSDDTQVLLWSFIGVVSMLGAIASVKKKMMKL